jgi:outer membrane receptor protein involved in Fe transport
MQARLFVAAFVVSTVSAAQPCAAQVAAGALSGLVRDPSGAVVVSASVTALHDDTNERFVTSTGTVGEYVLRALPVGRYTVEIAVPGFQTYRHVDVDVRVNDEVRIDAVLAVGELSETVVVRASPTTVDAATSTLKTVVDRQRIEQLPLNGRNPAQLTQLVGGVLPDSKSNLTAGQTYPGVQPISPNGARGNTTNYILDGGTNNDHYSNAPNPMPNPDALQEFSVQTNGFSAEYGRNPGAIVNAITRAGTNQWHGVGFGYVRDHRLNANNFFTPGVDDGLKRQQFGGTLGGPIARDRSFFFLSYEATNQQQQPISAGALVPTAAMRHGDFSLLPIPLRNPFTGQPFAGNQIPATLLNPAVMTILSTAIPLPNPSAGDNPLTLRFSVPLSLDDRQYLLRGDHVFSGSHRVYGRFWVSRADKPAYFDPANALTSSPGQTWQNTVASVNDTVVLSPTMLNNAVVTFNRTTTDTAGIYPADYRSLGINAYNDQTPQWVFNVGGFFSLNTGDTSSFTRNELQIVDTLRWTRGSHEFGAGVDYAYGQGDIANNFQANGRFAFSSASPFTGTALSDFMLGKFATFTQGVGEYKNTRMHSLAMFVQDTVRAGPRLTLNLGVRWDPFIPYTDVHDHLACYRPGARSQVYTNAPVGAVFPGDGACPAGGYDPAWTNIGPRVGFAYSPTAGSRSAIRASYGVFFDRPNTNATNSPADQAPFGTTISFQGNDANNVTSPYAGRANPFPLDPANLPRDIAFVLPDSMFSYDANLRNGRLQAWQASYEREIAPTYLIRAAYAGSYGDRLAMLRDLNAAAYAPGATTSTTDARRPLAPAFADITTVESTGRSRYNALQLTLDKRFRNGWSVLSNYTLSKAMDHSSENKENAATQTNPADLEFDWGPANFDRRHRWVTSVLWELPASWSIAAIWTLQSGAPFSILSGVDNARSGTSNQRADLIGDPTLPDSRSTEDQALQWFNAAAFAPNTLGTFGNTGRNAYRGPASRTLDFSVAKALSVHGGWKAQLRLDAFNALNSVNLGLPVTSRNSGNFGRILTAADPRILQLAVRFSF